MAQPGILYAAVQVVDDESPLEYVRDAAHKETCRKFVRLLKQNSDKHPAGEKRSFGTNSAGVPIVINSILAQDKTVVVAACKDDYNRSAVFECIQEVLKAYASLRQNRSALDRQLRTLTDKYSDPSSDKVSKIKNQLTETKQVMIDNIDKIIARGEDIDELGAKSENLLAQSEEFHAGAQNLHWTMLKKRIIMIIVILLIVGLAIFIIVWLACRDDQGAFHKCK